MKKNKKGFIFIETIVVVAVLTISLLMVYATYSSMIMKEKTRIKYNDSIYMYRTYYLTRFFKNFRLDFIANRLGEKVTKDEMGNVLETKYTMLTGFDYSSSEIFVNEEDNIGFTEDLMKQLHISHLYLTYKDLRFLQECKNASGKCEALVQVREPAAEYLKTIGGEGEGYRVVVEFSENKDGSYCTGEKCQFYYTTLSLGEF